jgi:predicted HicB family RNase H-like nuclease
LKTSRYSRLNRNITVRVEPEAYEALAVHANLVGEKLSELVRRFIAEGMENDKNDGLGTK